MTETVTGSGKGTAGSEASDDEDSDSIERMLSHGWGEGRDGDDGGIFQ